MKKYTDLIELLEKIFGKGSVSRTIGTRTNVVRFPKGKQPIDPTVSNFDVEGTAAKNPDLVQTIENSIADRMGEITKMNDQELLTYTANVRRLANFKEPPVQNADVIKFGSGEEIKGKGLEQLIEKQGTVNPPTTVAGQLETQGKKLEKAGEDLKEITEPRSLVGDMLKDYADFDKYMQSSQKTGYVRATVRQIMREDIQTGKLKLPKELQDQVMQGIGEPIDIYRKVYGEGALEQIDSLADDLGKFRTEEEAAKFARSKFEFTPKLDRPKESYTTEEMKKITSLEDPSKPYKPFGSDFTRQEKVDWLIKNVDQEAKVTIPSPEFLQNMLDSGREDLIDHFWEIHTKNIGSKPVIDIDTGNLKNPALVKAMMEDRAKKPKLVFSKEKVVEDSVDDAGKINKDDLEPEGKADGGRIGFNKGKRVKSQIDKLLEQLNKKTQGKKSMETVNPKTGEVTVPKKPIRRAEEPTGVTVMDPEPNIIDEKSITKNKSRQLTQDEIADYEEQLGDSETWMSEGTVDEAEKALKRSKAEEAYYRGQYKAGKLDPAPGENTRQRMRFLKEKAAEAEMTGDKRLFTLDEMDELENLESKFAYKQGDAITDENFADTPFAPSASSLKALELARKQTGKLSEAEMIKQKYGNVIDDNLLQQILIDDNPQRKAEVLASIDEAIKMQEKGIPYEEIINIMKNTTRTKQADGGIAGLL
jgi:hypothetical protein